MIALLKANSKIALRQAVDNDRTIMTCGWQVTRAIPERFIDKSF